jgi:hypothetical protein
MASSLSNAVEPQFGLGFEDIHWVLILKALSLGKNPCNSHLALLRYWSCVVDHQKVDGGGGCRVRVSDATRLRHNLSLIPTHVIDSDHK